MVRYGGRRGKPHGIRWRTLPPRSTQIFQNPLIKEYDIDWGLLRGPGDLVSRL